MKIKLGKNESPVDYLAFLVNNTGDKNEVGRKTVLLKK